MKHALLLFVLLGSGCASVHYDAEESSPKFDTRLPLPVRVGVKGYVGPHSGLHEQLIVALKRDANFAVVMVTPTGEAERNLDYVVDLEYGIETNAKWYNFFTCFPGFLIFAPHWARLRWDFDVTTYARLLRPRRGGEVGKFERTDAHDLVYTSPGYAVACNIGFLGILFPPAAGAPLFAGFSSALSNGQGKKYRKHFYRSEACRNWASLVSVWIADLVEEDLGPPGPG